MNKPITICIIDHQKLLCSSFPLLLKDYPEFTVVIVGGTLDEVKQYIAFVKNVPDVFLIDIQLLKHHSTNIVFWMQKHYPDARLIAISNDLKHAKIKAMLVAGCTAFFGMTINITQLYSGICDVYNKCFISKLDDYIDKGSFLKAKRYNGYPVVDFSVKELDVLEYLCTNMTYVEIEKILNAKHGYVNHYAQIIFYKLNIHTRSDLIMIALHHGLIEEISAIDN